MSRDAIIFGYIRVLPPRYTEVGQRRAMTAKGIEPLRILQEGGKESNGSLSEVIRMLRKGCVLAVQHGLLLSDPTRDRQLGGSRQSFFDSFDGIEERGAHVWELYTDLRTNTKAGRDKFTRATIEALARGRHKTRRSDKRGRPSLADMFTDAQWDAAQAKWESRKLKTWADVQAKLPAGMTVHHCYARFGKRETD